MANLQNTSNYDIIIVEGKVMKECYSYIQKKRMEGESIFAGSTNVRYGKEDGIKEIFDEIIKIDDETLRHQRVDELLSTMERNTDNNGFIPANEAVYLENGMRQIGAPQFKIDDKNIYYLFIDRYKALREANPDKSDSIVHYVAVKDTIAMYFGLYNGNPTLRKQLTTPEVDYDRFGADASYKVETPSISRLRAKSCAMCIERASVSHNLWLLGGYESYFVNAGSINFPNVSDEGHAYCLVHYNDRFRLFDPAMQVYKALEVGQNPIEDILTGKPFVVGDMVYANASSLDDLPDASM